MTADLQSTACPYCLCAIAPDDPMVVCPACSFTYHRECWNTLGGCAVEGCSKMVEVKKADITSTYWGATQKVCPLCAETIPVSALQCPCCQAIFSEMRPMSRDDVLHKADDPEAERDRKRAIWLLIFSVLGFTSPLALLIGWIWYARNRMQIQRTPTTKAMVLASLGICIAYFVMAGVGTVIYSISQAMR